MLQNEEEITNEGAEINITDTAFQESEGTYIR